MAIYTAPVAGRRKKGTRGGRRPGAGRKGFLKDAASFTGDFEKAQMDALQAMAEERGVSVAQLVRDAIQAFLKRRNRI
jgi:hypothetical protein